MELQSDRRYRFSLSPTQFWSQISDVGSYRTWWPWLRHFDADALAVGAVWDCVVQPPLPYRVSFTLTLDAVDPARSIETTIRGDIHGRAYLAIDRDDRGCAVRLRSSLGPTNRGLRVAGTVARPLLRFGHQWVLDTGARQFEARAT